MSESTLEQLKSVILPDLGGDTSRTDIRIPTLEEYVWICKKYQKYCVLEIKDVFSEEEIKDVIRVYSAAEYLDHLVVISFSMRSCLRARKLLPNNRVQLLAGELSEEARRTALENRLDVDLYYPAVDAALVKEFHEKDLLVNCYTVNTPEVAEQLIALGVDMITSNILE